MLNFRPMLAASLDGVDLRALRYPLLVSPKLDGVRCIVWEGVAYSRNAKPIRNNFVQKWASSFHNLDGELIVGPPTDNADGTVLGRTQSGVMSFSGEPDFHFHLFDTISKLPFLVRAGSAQCKYAGSARIENVTHYEAADVESLRQYEQEFLLAGYEGVMLRDPSGPYKHGRSTIREGWLMKLKRFQDGEAIVIGLVEQMHNTNELQQDELGRAKRSKMVGGLVPSGMVGAIVVKDPTWGVLQIAPGTMLHRERQLFWEHPERLVGKTIHWRSFGYGMKDAPRFARFYGIRDGG